MGFENVTKTKYVFFEKGSKYIEKSSLPVMIFFCVFGVRLYCLFVFVFCVFLCIYSFISRVHVYAYGQRQVIADFLPINVEKY